MATRTKSKPETETRNDQIRQMAYAKWLAAYNGQPVDQTETDRIWVEAEREFDSQEKPKRVAE